MTDLSSPNMQRIFKSVHRLNVSLYIVMLLIMLSGIGLAVLMATRLGNYYGGLDWAQITYIVILGITFLFAIAVLALNLWTRKPYKSALATYVADTFAMHETVLKGGKNVEVEMYFIGDKLTIAKQGCEELIYFDLAPIRRYSGSCTYIFSLVKKYLYAYYGVNAKKDGYYSVAVTDAIGGKPRVFKAVEGGEATKDCAKNVFVVRGDIALEN